MIEIHYTSRDTNSPFKINATLADTGSFVLLAYNFELKNEIVGDNEVFGLLSVSYNLFGDVLKKKGQRKFEYDKSIKPSDLVDDFIEKYTETGGYKEIVHLDINCESESFNSVFIYLIEEEGYDLFLSKDTYSDKYVCAKIPKDIFYKEIDQFYTWVLRNTVLRLKI